MVPSYRVSLSLSLSTCRREGGFIMLQDLARRRIQSFDRNLPLCWSRYASLSHAGKSRPFRYPSGRRFGRKMPRCRTLANYDHFLAWTSSFLVAICLPITKWQISTLFRYQQTAFWLQSASLSHASSLQPFPSANNRDFGRKMPRCSRMAFYDHPSFAANLYGLRNFSTPYHSARALPCAGLRWRVE